MLEGCQVNLKTFQLVNILLQILKYRSRAHATANTHGDHAILGLAAAHFIDQLGGEFGACAAAIFENLQ